MVQVSLLARGAGAIAVLALSGVVAVPAAVSAQPARTVVITAATSTPEIEAGSGVAQFTAAGLPKGNAYLQWLNPATNTWVNLVKVAKTGRTGTASAGNLAAGVNQFRVFAGRTASAVIPIKTYQVFSTGGETKIINGIPFPLQTTVGQRVTLPIKADRGCTYVNFAMEAGKDSFSGWSLTATITTEGVPPKVYKIDSWTSFIQTNIPVAGLTTVDFQGVQTTSISTGVQAHCLANPF